MRRCLDDDAPLEAQVKAIEGHLFCGCDKEYLLSPPDETRLPAGWTAVFWLETDRELSQPYAQPSALADLDDSHPNRLVRRCSASSWLHRVGNFTTDRGSGAGR